jgi:hypothetical protein
MNPLGSEDILALLRQLDTLTVRQHKLLPNDGYIFTKNGRIFVMDAQAGGRQPTLISSPFIEITVNGVPAVNTAVVTASDDIAWQVVRLPHKPYELACSEDGMAVTLTVRAENMIRPTLRETAPCLFYSPELEETPRTDWNELESDILRELEEMRVQSSCVKREWIIPAMMEQSGHPVMIAEGIPAKPGRDGYVETYFANATESVITEWNKAVNYREHTLIPSVEPGTPLGKIHLAVPGEAGVDVFGRHVPPPQVSEVVVRLRRNVEMNENGQIVALKAGRPSLTGEKIKYFDIQTVYTVAGDVDLSTGNVYFNGDVVVQGDIQEGMRVEASGNIYVFGSAHHATIVSAQNIYVRGHVTKCQLYGGKLGLLYSNLYRCLKQLTEQYDGLERDAKQLWEASQAKGTSLAIGQIFGILIEMRYQDLRKRIAEFDELLRGAGNMLPMEFTMASRLLALFRNRHLMNGITQLSDFRKIYDYLRAIRVQIENSVFEESDIVVSSANLSRLETNGSLVVTGPGLVNCEVKVNKNCLFKHPESSCKGGKIEARGRIVVPEAGTPFGKNTYLYVGQSIKVGRAAGVTIRVGSRLIEILEEQTNLFFSLDREGNLQQERNRHRDRVS